MGLYFWLRGEVRLALRCRWPERALNLAAREGVRFRALAVTEEGVELTTSPRDARALLRLAERTGLFSAAVLARRGLPFLLWGLRRRRALAAGLALSLLLLTLSNFYIWQIEVYGNETVPTAELLSALREEGVHTGLSVFAVDRVGVSLGLLRRVPALSWATVNVRGSRVWVLVREAKPAPEMLTGDAPAALIAARDGTITGLTVLSGRALFRRGDSVRAGET
ncbi:MAG: sporulation protein YqfD, partial [bacterium]